MTNKADFAAAMTAKEALKHLRITCDEDTPCDACIRIKTCRHKQALSVLTALVEECKQFRAESNGKNWQGIARIAALETENKRLKDAVAHFTATIAAELKRSAAYAESCRKAEAELAAARAEVEHWKTEAKETGERGLSAVFDLEKAEAELDALTESVSWFKNVNADWEAWAKRSEKGREVLAKENAALEAELAVARAEVVRAQDRHTIDLMELDAARKAEAELDAARPLIEAAMGYKPEPFGHGRERLHEAAIDYADAYRERRDREQKEKT